MKILFFSATILAVGFAATSNAQSKKVELNPFIQWEIQQIATIDSFRWAPDTIPDTSEEDPYWIKLEGRLEDSILSRKIDGTSDLTLSLEAIDTLTYSVLSNAAIAGWYEYSMDQLLNTVYRMVMSESSADGKSALRTDERAWLKRRDAYIKMKRRWQDRNPGTMYVQMASGDIGDFIRKRVLFLATKIKS